MTLRTNIATGDLQVDDHAEQHDEANQAILDLQAADTALDTRVDALEAGAGAAVLYTIAPSSDTYIDSGANTTNYDTAVALFMGDDWASGTFARRALLTFDISTLAGKTLQRCDLRLWTSSYGAATGSHFITARKVRRAYSPTQATWDVYSTGNNWTTGGARDTTNDVYPEFYGGGALPHLQLAPFEIVLDLRTMVQAAIDATETTLRVVIGPDETDNQNYVGVHSLESATAAYRPKLTAVG